MALHICTYDDLELFEGMEETRKPVHIGQYERLVCPACHKQFTAPKFSLGNMISCKFCGWTDEIETPMKSRKLCKMDGCNNRGAPGFHMVCKEHWYAMTPGEQAALKKK